MSALEAIGLDRYDRNARLKPALFAVLPLFALVAIWWPNTWTFVVGLTGLLTACGLTYLMSRVARQRGRKIEGEIKRQLGAMPTTIALRRSDSFIDPVTKARYHSFFERNGLEMPTSDEERSDPAGADNLYSSAVKWLLESTRDRKRFGMLFDENVDYGFRRNLRGLKWIALPILFVAFLLNAGLVWRSLDETQKWVGIGLGCAYCLVFLAWIVTVKRAFVLDAAWSYAQRLLAACDVLEMRV